MFTNLFVILPLHFDEAVIPQLPFHSSASTMPGVCERIQDQLVAMAHKVVAYDADRDITPVPAAFLLGVGIGANFANPNNSTACLLGALAWFGIWWLISDPVNYGDGGGYKHDDEYWGEYSSYDSYSYKKSFSYASYYSRGHYYDDEGGNRRWTPEPPTHDFVQDEPVSGSCDITAGQHLEATSLRRRRERQKEREREERDAFCT